MATIFRRGKTWWINYRVSGKVVQKSLDTTNQQVAIKKKKQVEGLEAAGQLDLPTKIPLSPFLESFCAFLKQRHTERAYRANISYLRSFFGPICPSLEPGPKKKGNTKKPRKHSSKGPASSVYRRHVNVRFLEDVTPTLINHFITQRVDTDGIAPKTANRTREILHVMFNYAIRHHGFVSPVRGFRNPAGAVERRLEAAPQIRFLDLKDVASQLKTLEGCPALHGAVATMIYAGLRREACLWLTRDDVDLKRKVIRVRAKTVQGKTWQPKTKKNRAVPINS